MKSNKSVNIITILNILSTLILQGLTFFASPIISRMLGPSNYGMASVYATWVALFSTVFGLQTQSTIAVARKEYPEEEQKACNGLYHLHCACRYMHCVLQHLFCSR